MLIECRLFLCTKGGETVLDNCMGSGTTAIACLNTNRNFIGFELDETYYNLSLQRIAQKAVKTVMEQRVLETHRDFMKGLEK